jgi:hypothetical protein
MVEGTVVAIQRHEFTGYDGCDVRAVGHFTGNFSAVVGGKEAI